MNLLTVQSPSWCNFLHLRTKRCPQYPVQKHLQSVFFLKARDQMPIVSIINERSSTEGLCKFLLVLLSSVRTDNK
jgi:hypothetical protein